MNTSTTVKPPAVPVSEQVVMAALNFHPDWLSEIRIILPEPEMFYTRSYPAIYKGMLDLAERDKPFDLILAADQSGVPVGDACDILLKLPSDLWMTANLFHDSVVAHATLVQDAWLKREAIAAAHRQDGMAELSEKLNRLAIMGADRQYDAEDLAMILIESAHDDRKKLDYPFASLQTASGGGVRPDELVIVAARPATGKSAMLSQWAWHLATQGKRILFVSAEMSAQSLTRRLASQIMSRNLINPKTSDDFDAIDNAANQIAKTGLKIHELTSTPQLESALKQLRDGLDAVFVDYLQLLIPGRRTSTEFEQVTAVTRELDTMSMKYGLPFVVASQFSRNAQGNQPQMSDLRSSGQIEQAADVIVSLWSKPEEETNPNRAKIYFDVLKNRNGYTLHNTPTRQYAFTLDKPCFTFREMDQHQREAA